MWPEVAGPLENGVRVSLELPEAGTCVAVVSQTGQSSLTLDLHAASPPAMCRMR